MRSVSADAIREGLRTLPFDELYEVGGSLRDELLGREPKDVDVLVRGHSIDELIVALAAQGPVAELVVAGRLVGARFWPRYGPREGIEVVPPRRETAIPPGDPEAGGNPHTDFRIEPDPQLAVEDDLLRRDFTVNAMARDLRSGAWHDPFGGRHDLAAGVLRVVHETAFRDDPLRILRGIARCSIDGLSPDEATAALMRASAARIGELSPERIRGELDRTLAGEAPGRALRIARELGVLGVALPEWAHCIGAVQDSPTQAWTLDEHILCVLDGVVAAGAGPDLRLAALWHDVGKPFVHGIHEHAAEGARIARAALRRLTYDNDTVAHVVKLVREHAYGDDRAPTEEGARRFLARVGRPAADELLHLRRADRSARGTPDPVENSERRQRFERLVREQSHQPVTLAELAVDGADLLEAGWLEGPELGRTLHALLDVVLGDPSLNERDQLLALASATDGDGVRSNDARRP